MRKNITLRTSQDKLHSNSKGIKARAGVIAPVAAEHLPHLNEHQLAERWSISLKKLQADRLKGCGVPFIRLGRAVRYRFADVVAWEERHLHVSTSELVTSTAMSNEDGPARGASHRTGR